MSDSCFSFEGAVGYFWLHCGMQMNGFQLLLCWDDASQFETDDAFLFANRNEKIGNNIILSDGFREIHGARDLHTERYRLPMAVSCFGQFYDRPVRVSNAACFIGALNCAAPINFQTETITFHFVFAENRFNIHRILQASSSCRCICIAALQ